MNKFNLEEIKSNISIIDIAKNLGIEHNKSHWRCINGQNHKNNDEHFSMSIKKNYFKCFSCDIKGDIISFVMITKKIGFVEAVTLLSKYSSNNYHSDFNKDISPLIERKASIINDNSLIFLCEYDEYLLDERLGMAECYQGIPPNIETYLNQIKKHRLEKNKSIFKIIYDYSINYYNGINNEIMEYLVNERLIEESILKKNKIFALPPSMELNNYLLKNVDPIELKGTGIIQDNGKFLINNNYKICIPYLQNEDIVYLRFRKFPVNKSNNKLNKYMGLKNDSLNLNTTKRFYNLNSLNTVLPGEEIFITEGELDSLILETMGNISIAIPGVTSLPSINEFEKLLNYKIVLCFDNDEPGIILTEKVERIFIDYGLKVDSVKFHQNIKDVSEFINNYKYK